MFERLVQPLADVVTIGPVLASPTDFLRLLVVPVFGWTAYRDVKTRRVPNRTWVPLVAFGVALLAVDAWLASQGQPGELRRFAVRAGLSLGFVVPLSYIFWRIGGFGGADAKALMVLALLFPATPQYLFRPPLTDLALPVLGSFPGSLPLVRNEAGIFSFTVLTNGVIAGIVYPLLVTLRNLLAGRIAPVMFIGRPVPVSTITETYGRLLETPDGTTRRGLDIDALRMYLQWRGISLSEVRENPDRFRDPASLPEEPNPPGDGAITDGGRPVDDPDDEAAAAEDESGDPVEERPEETGDGDPAAVEDGDTPADGTGDDDVATVDDLVDGSMFGVEDSPAAEDGSTESDDGSTGTDEGSTADHRERDVGSATESDQSAGEDTTGEPARVDETTVDPADEDADDPTDEDADDPTDEDAGDRAGERDRASDPADGSVETTAGVEEPGAADVGIGVGESSGAGVDRSPESGETPPEPGETSPEQEAIAPGASIPPEPDDPWGAEAFLEDVGSAYGTTPEDLRDGLEVLVAQDDVWVSPGLPFLVPVFLGLLVAMVYGDLLFGLLGALGIV